MSRKRKGVPVHGWLVIDKPVGITSAAVVGKVKRLTNAAKVGHAGTLDPLASGILPLALGEATKTVSYAMDGSKTYRFTLRFGETRTTDDAEGEVTATSDIRPDDDAIRTVLPRFIGTIRQRPPAFSALKVDGQRAYDLARAGEEAVLEEREITITRLDLLARPNADHADFEVCCGKGTYVRSLARDIAAALGTVGYVAALRRTQVGRFTEEQAFLLDSSDENRHGAAALERLLPITTALDDIPALALTEAQADDLRHGRSISLARSGFPDLERSSAIPADRVVLATLGGGAVALCRLNEDPSVWGLSPWRVFNL